MPARFPPRDEVDALLDDLRAAAGCVTKTILVPSPDQYNPARTYNITFTHHGYPVPLSDRSTSGRSGLMMHIRHQYEIIENPGANHSRRWRTQTTAYAYRLLDYEERELLVFH